LSATIERARVAALTRSRTPDDPDLVQARGELVVATTVDYVKKLVATAPPLTPSQRDTIAAAFAGFAPMAGEAA
jgi:hypothetical protein